MSAGIRNEKVPVERARRACPSGSEPGGGQEKRSLGGRGRSSGRGRVHPEKASVMSSKKASGAIDLD
jgi:hypothetical protein